MRGVSLVFLFLLLICLIMFRPIRIDEWVVSLAGYLTPAYIVIMLLFLYNNLSLLSAWSKGGMYHLEITKDMRPLIATLAGCSLLVMGGVYMLLQSGQMINIQIRRSWTALFFYLFTAIGAAFLIPNAVIGGWLIALPPLSLVAAPALATDKYKKFANFTLIFSILFLAFTLYINK